jgi:hypothetical protein
MEEIITIIEVAETITKGLGPLAVAGIAQAIPGIARGIGSLFGGGKRKDRERLAQTRRDKQMALFEATEFTNPYTQVQNEFEDLRVSTEAAEFQAQQQQQGLAQGLDTFRSAGGGTGAAAIAQAMAQQQAKGLQSISADIAKQEAMNERLSAQGAMKAAQLVAGGEAQRQQLEMGKQSQLLGMANQDLASATRARAQAKADLVGGIGALGSAAFSAFGSKIGNGSAAGGDAASLGTFAPDYSSSLLANTAAAGAAQAPTLAYDSFMQTAFNKQNFSGVDNPAPRNQFSYFTDMKLPKIGG